MRVLIVGCGYVGKQVARLLHDRGDCVYVTTRSPVRASEWLACGWQPVVADVTQPDSLAALPTVDLVIHSVGYDRHAGIPKRDVYVDGLKNVLTALDGRFERFVFTSSTSVYGQSAGETVDENSPAVPDADGGRICLEAEQVIGQWSSTATKRVNFMIVRFAGLYGPGRLRARMEGLRAGEPWAGRADAWLNLIHRDDAARLAIAVGERGRGGGTYLGVDEEPVRREDFYARLADLVGAPEPIFDPNETGARGSSAGLNKRCDGTRTQQEFGFQFDFPTYREGLDSSVAESD
jgi:nucleoside-diphosphate-sugar epimerase